MIAHRPPRYGVAQFSTVSQACSRWVGPPHGHCSAWAPSVFKPLPIARHWPLLTLRISATPPAAVMTCQAWSELPSWQVHWRACAPFSFEPLPIARQRLLRSLRIWVLPPAIALRCHSASLARLQAVCTTCAPLSLTPSLVRHMLLFLLMI